MIYSINGIKGIQMQAVNYTKTTQNGDFSEELKRASLRAMNSGYVPENASAYRMRNVTGTEEGMEKTAAVLSERGKKTCVSISDQGSFNPVTAYDDYFEEAAEKYGVPVSLLKAVAKIESNYTETAVSPSGAMGVMQLMPGTAQAMGVSDAFDPRQNILGGAKCLSTHLDEFNGDVSLALAAYNAGSGAVKRAGGVPSSGVQGYVDSVLEYYQS